MEASLGEPATAFEPRRLQAMGDGGAAGADLAQRLFFLDAGRVSLLGGWLVATYTFGNPAARPAHVVAGFALLLLGVFLLTLSPAARQYPWVERTVAVVANAVLNHLFALGN